VDCRLRIVQLLRRVISASAIVATLSLLILCAPSETAQSANDEKPPVAWGVLAGNSGCVIFAESRKTDAKFVGVFIIKWHYELNVLEAQHYDVQRKQWKETRDDLNELQKLAEQNKLKFVKIPTKHTAQQLEKARLMCTQPPAPAKE
jgi:hypothetical protein